MGLEIVVGVGMGGNGGSSKGGPGGDGPAKEILEISSRLGVAGVEGDGTKGPPTGGVSSTSESRLDEGGDTSAVDGGKGMSLGVISSTYDNSLSDGIEGTSDGSLTLTMSSSISGAGSSSSNETSLDSGLGSRMGSGGIGVRELGSEVSSEGVRSRTGSRIGSGKGT